MAAAARLFNRAGYHGTDSNEIARAADAYLNAYSVEGLPVLDAELSRATGCLVLARVIGDSPVDYLDSADLRAAGGTVLYLTLVALLASDAAGWITGQTIPVNGGLSFAL